MIDRYSKTAVCSEILRNITELGYQLLCLPCLLAAHNVLQAVIDMIMNQRFLGVIDCSFHCLKLLRQLHARAALREHFDDVFQMAICTAETLGNVRMGSVHGYGISVR